MLAAAQIVSLASMITTQTHPRLVKIVTQAKSVHLSAPQNVRRAESANLLPPVHRLVVTVRSVQPILTAMPQHLALAAARASTLTQGKQLVRNALLDITTTIAILRRDAKPVTVADTLLLHLSPATIVLLASTTMTVMHRLRASLALREPTVR